MRGEKTPTKSSAVARETLYVDPILLEPLRYTRFTHAASPYVKSCEKLLKNNPLMRFCSAHRFFLQPSLHDFARKSAEMGLATENGCLDMTAPCSVRFLSALMLFVCFFSRRLERTSSRYEVSSDRQKKINDVSKII